MSEVRLTVPEMEHADGHSCRSKQAYTCNKDVRSLCVIYTVSKVDSSTSDLNTVYKYLTLQSSAVSPPRSSFTPYNGDSRGVNYVTWRR
jgi:hypothetical protein